MRRLAAISALLLSSCYLSHQVTDADAGLLFACGGLLHSLPSADCDTFLFSADTGTSSCTTSSGATVSGPTFTVITPRDATFNVHVIAPDGSLIHVAAANGSEPCATCTAAEASGTGEVITPVSHVNGVRIVVSSVASSVPFSATICR